MNEFTSSPSTKRPGKQLHILLVAPQAEMVEEWARWIQQVTPGTVVQIAQGLEQAHTLIPALTRPPHLIMVHATMGVEKAFEFLTDLHTAHPKIVALVMLNADKVERLEEIAGGEWIDTLSLPCEESDFYRAFRNMRLRLSPGGQGRFEGTFRNLRIFDILQLKCTYRESCILDFDLHSCNSGQVWIEKGQIRHAEAGGLHGIPALALMVNSRGGSVSEQKFDPHRGWASIKGSWEAALLEAAQEVDHAYGGVSASKLEDGESPLMVRASQDPGKATSLVEGRQRILIADDSPLMLQFMQEVIWRTHPDIAIITLETGGEVVAAAKQYIPDVIVLDFFLPDHTGDEVCHDLLLFEETKDIPVILISGQLTDLSNLSREHPNIQSFLRKPFFPPQIIQSLHAAAPHLKEAEKQET